MNFVVPEKHYYTIGDVCKLTGIKPHILRYWESQFKLLRPARRYSGHRKYTQREIDLITRIKQLVVDRRFTLEGAKRELNRLYSSRPQPAPHGQTAISAIPALQEIKNDIEACLSLLTPGKNEELFDLK
ncbi:MAG: hypothetical protein KCHDKBKB_02621 [Elusimicrobia bacterium]|nr:hypothetical protein [Elusimicrobiota bacterium]